MKESKDYDIFNDVNPFDVIKLLTHLTTKQRNEYFKPLTIFPHGAIRCHHPIYNTDTKRVEWTRVDGLTWSEVTDYKTIKSSTEMFAPTYYETYQSEISSAKAALKKAQEVKQGKFSYLWKDVSTQTEAEMQEQGKQVTVKITKQNMQKEKITSDISSHNQDTYIDTPTLKPIEQQLNKPQKLQVLSDEYLQEINAKLPNEIEEFKLDLIGDNTDF